MHGATKAQTASKLHNLLRMDTQPLIVKSGFKLQDYRSYKVRVYEELVPGAGSSCHIYDPSGEPLAHRRGIDAAKLFIDERESKFKRFKVKLSVPVTKVTIRVKLFRKR